MSGFSPHANFPPVGLSLFLSFSSFLLHGSVVILFYISPQAGKYIYFHGGRYAFTSIEC